MALQVGNFGLYLSKNGPKQWGWLQWNRNFPRPYNTYFSLFGGEAYLYAKFHGNLIFEVAKVFQKCLIFRETYS